MFGNGLVRSPDGSVFAAGSFVDSSDLGSGLIDVSPPGAGNSNPFLARLDPSTGQAIWTQTFSGTGREDVTSFDVNGGGQIGIVGPLLGTLTVGATTLEAVQAAYYVLGASSTDGTGQWARRVSLLNPDPHVGKALTGLAAVAGDPNNNTFVVCGTTNEAANDLFPSLVWQGGTDIVLASLSGDDAGKTSWALQIGGVNDEKCSAVAVDSQSNIYLVGTYKFGSTVTIAGVPPAGQLPMSGQTGTAEWLFVAKLDSSGNGIWVKGFGAGQQVQSASAVIVMPNAAGGEDLVVAGAVAGTLSFAGVTVQSGAFVAMLDGSNGDVRWVKAVGTGVGSRSVTAFSANSAGNLVAAGQYDGSLVLGGTALPTLSGTPEAFLALMDPVHGGDFLGASGYGDPQYPSQAVGVMTDQTGAGVEKDTTLFLARFVGQVGLGQPAGTLVSSSKKQAIAAVKIAP
jgi:hypothetical protein